MVSVIIRGSLLQLATPPEMRGRVSAVNSLFIGASNELGEFESGLTAQWWGAVRATIFGGWRPRSCRNLGSGLPRPPPYRRAECSGIAAEDRFCKPSNSCGRLIRIKASASKL